MHHLVDTNVAIAANGRDTHACIECQISCIQFLSEICKENSGETIVIDDGGLILEEYRGYLNYHGQPGVGDMFYKYLHDHMYSGNSIIFTTVNPNNEANRGFDELPINPIDPSDRVFAAAAIVGGARISNALDTDWHEKREFIASIGVSVMQHCPMHGCVE